MEDSDHHQSVAVIGSNDDLLTEILIRLPVTSILRFKSVSKHWRSLLTHRHFTRLYDNNISKSRGLFFSRCLSKYVPFDVENPSPPPFRSLGFYFNRSDVRIEQSCNGLLLCHAFHNGVNKYYVFNPTTKQRAFIPSGPKYVWSMALAFHQAECVHYKVVCVTRLDPDKNMFRIHMYSSDTGKWKICVESFCVKLPNIRNQVYWNGAVYWVPCYHDLWYFKLDVEELQKLPMPEELGSYYELSPMYFGESRGHLHLTSHSKFEERILNVNVYEMLRDCSGWFVKYRVQVDELRSFPEMFERYSGVVDVVRGKEEEETFLVLLTDGKYIRYNVHDKSFNEICSRTEYDFDFYIKTSNCRRYIETLSSF